MRAISRRLWLAVLAGVLVCCCLVAPGRPAGRTRQALAPLVVGTPVQGTLAYGDAITYTLTLDAAGPLELRYAVQPQLPGALSLELRTTDAVPVVKGRVRNSLNEKVLYLANVDAGTYTVVLAQDNAGVGTVNYTLSASRALTTAALETAVIPGNGNTTVYPLPIDADGPLYVLVKKPQVADSAAQLYGSEITGDPLATDAGAGSQLLYLGNATANSTCYLLLGGTGVAAAAVPCTVTVLRDIPQVAITDDRGALAGSIDGPGDIDLYRVTAAADKPLYLSLFKETGWASYVEVRQGSAAGNILYQTDRGASALLATSDPWFSVPAPVGGEYFIRVEHFARDAAVPAPLPYSLYALQALPALTDTVSTVALPGPHSVRWYRLPATLGQPAFAFADHNSENSVSISLHLRDVNGIPAVIASGTKDQLAYLPGAINDTYYVRVGDSSAPSISLTGGQHLPALPVKSFTDKILNTSDIHWYEVTVADGESLLLHLDKAAAFATDLPMRFSSPLNAPAGTETTAGDVSEALTGPLTTFVRVSGAAGSYTLRATSAFTNIPMGQFAETALQHAGDERWFEATAPAGQPLYLVADKEGAGSPTYEVYRGALGTEKAATIGGATSDYAYLPPQVAATRYLIRKRAPDAGFVKDTTERLMAGIALPALAAGGSQTGHIASANQRRFYALNQPLSKPITLQCTLPMVITEPGHVKRLEIGTRAAVAGLGAPAVITLAATGAADYTLSASADLSTAGTLYYSNAQVEAKIDLAKTTVGRVKYYAGDNAYLSTDGDGAQFLLEPEGTDYAAGWTMSDLLADTNGLQITWRLLAKAVTRTIAIRSSAAGADLACEVDTPRPMTFHNALIVPTLTNGTLNYAIPGNPITPKMYTAGGVTPLYPPTAGAFASPSERWAAFWNSQGREVYGVALGADHQLALYTDGAYTVTRVLAPAGHSAFTMRIAPKPEVPYAAMQSGALAPAFLLTHTADATAVPVGSPITGTLTLQNIGTLTATGTAVTCTLPDTTIYEDGSAGTGVYTPASRVITWLPGTLAPGAVQTFTYRFQLISAMPLETTATLSSAVRSTELPTPKRVTCTVTAKGPALSGVTPPAPDNGGPVTLGVYGSYFAETSTVTLVNGTQTVTASSVVMRSDRKKLSALVDLTGLTGTWDVRVTNPGGGTTLLPAAITPKAGGLSEFWCELSAPRTLKLNEWSTVTVQYGNRGSADEVGRLLTLYLPGAQYAVGTAKDENNRVLAAADLAGSLDGPLAWWLPRVGPGELHTITLTIKPLATRGRAAGGLFPEATLATAALSRAQLDALLTASVKAAFNVPAAKDGTVVNLATTAVPAALAGWTGANAQPAWSPADALVKAMRADGVLAPLLPAADATAAGAVTEKAVELLKNGTGYPPLAVRRQYVPGVTAEGPVHTMVGPLGQAAAGFLLPGQSLGYVITARNPATAAAPVKTVRISDKLDASLDWTSIVVGTVRIGGKTAAFNAAVTPPTAFLDLRPEINSVVQVTVGFNATTGELLWTATGADPATAALSAMLRPNTTANAPLGEMEVQLYVRPKANLASGVIIRNKASVTLDDGAAAATNEVMNTLDTAAPTSQVAALPAVQQDTSFTVSWSGADEANGSGLAYYTIFVSDNGGPYAVWQSRVSATSATFTGDFGHAYTFYSVAEDAVGHMEAAPATPDATTRIGRQVTFGRGLRLVSIPLQPETADPKVFAGFTSGKWARYLPGSGYVSYSNDPLKVTWLQPAGEVPGRAFWGYWIDAKTIEPVGQETDRTATFRIALAEGWNTFGNPWTKPVAWDGTAIKVTAGTETKTLAQAAAAGWIADYAWGWTPGTTNPSTGQYWLVGTADVVGATHQLDGWQGYWIKTTRACTLVLPPPTTVLAQTRARARAADGWQVRLTASTADGEDGFNWFGVGTAAVVARARSVANPPSPPEPTVELSFAGGRAIDLREPDAPASWHFTVTAPVPGETVTLRWPDLTGLPGDVALVLVDEGTNERRYLRTCAEYTFTAPADGRAARFRIETAARGALRLLGLSAGPAGRGAGVAVNFRLTTPATVHAEVRTPTGRLIRTLAPTRAADGALLWDGRDADGRRLGRGLVLITVIADGADGQRVRGAVPCQTP